MTGGLYNPRPVDDVPVNGQLTHGVTSNWAFDHAADYDAHMSDMLQYLRTGEYHLGHPIAHSVANSPVVANTLWAVPYWVSRPHTVDREAIDVTVLEAGTSARLGIYNDGANLYPGTLLVDAGVVSLAAVAIVAAIINQALTPGLYWLAMVSDATGVANVRRYGGSSPSLGVRVANFSNRYIGWSVAQAYGALPDPFTAGGALQYTGLHLSPLRILSLD